VNLTVNKRRKSSFLLLRISVIGYGEANPAMHEAAPKELYSKEAKANMRALFEIIVK